MKHILRLSVTLPILILLSACASTPDPAKVCSAEWIAPRTEKAISRIESKASSSVQKLGKASKTWASGKDLNVFQLVALSRALNGLEKELTRGQGIKDLRTVAKTCNDPKLIGNSMRKIFTRQGVPDKLMSQIEANPIYERIISTLMQPEPVIPKR